MTESSATGLEGTTAGEWRLLGAVVRTQVHVDRMVQGGYYDHDKIVKADELWLGPDGVVAMIDGQAVLHAHHRLHPNKSVADRPRKFLPARLLSFGFTGHYDLMADRFGAAPLGCAAEDVIVDHDGQVALDQLQSGLQLRRGAQVLDLTGVAIARPCVPFTKFMLDDQQADDETVAPNRAFLDEGMRGFLVGLANYTQAVSVLPGDELWAHAGSAS